VTTIAALATALASVTRETREAETGTAKC
jgi:hypothetical protein